MTRTLWHVARGLLIVHAVFPRADRACRERHIARWSARLFDALGVGVRRQGTLAPGAKLIVANHISWLDIMALHAECPEARFVAMAELRQWTGVVRLVDAARTIYLQRRQARDLRRVVHEVAQSLRGGDSVAVFPEGVVSDGRGLGPFHGNLLEAALIARTPIQPVALRYAGADGDASDAVCFTAEVSLMRSLWRLASAEAVVLHVTALPPIGMPATDRRSLANRLRDDIARALGHLDDPA